MCAPREAAARHAQAACGQPRQRVQARLRRGVGHHDGATHATPARLRVDRRRRAAARLCRTDLRRQRSTACTDAPGGVWWQLGKALSGARWHSVSAAHLVQRMLHSKQIDAQLRIIRRAVDRLLPRQAARAHGCGALPSTRVCRVAVGRRPRHPSAAAPPCTPRASSAATRPKGSACQHQPRLTSKSARHSSMLDASCSLTKLGSPSPRSSGLLKAAPKAAATAA